MSENESLTMGENGSLTMSENESLSISAVVWQAMLIIWYITQDGKALPELKTPVITRALHTLDRKQRFVNE